jgi:hypothetical protein
MDRTKASLLKIMRGGSAKGKSGMKKMQHKGILDDLRSGNRVLYLQEVPKVKVSHCRAWDCIPRRRTGEPIIRSYYRFALKGGTNLYSGGIIPGPIG